LEIANYSGFTPQKMVIFHGYVSLPEGNCNPILTLIVSLGSRIFPLGRFGSLYTSTIQTGCGSTDSHMLHRDPDRLIAAISGFTSIDCWMQSGGYLSRNK